MEHISDLFAYTVSETQRTQQEQNKLSYALEKEKIKLARESLYTPEEKARADKEQRNLYFSNKLGQWRDDKCSWFTPRDRRIRAENELIAVTTVLHHNSLPALIEVLASNPCSDPSSMHKFLAHLV